MIQDIHPHRFDIDYKPRPAKDDDCVVVLDGSRLLLPEAGEDGALPRYGVLKTFHPGLDGGLVYLFAVDDTSFFLYNGILAEPPGFTYQDIQALRSFQPLWMAFAGVTASHLGLWYGKNRFCGVCGGEMRGKGDERALKCGSCGEVVYPRISPAVIVGVVDGDRLLLTRYADRPGVRWALVAGFMEIGESVEDTVRREVMEEVGLKVKNIRYYKSQPWGFSGSVLMGLYAEVEGSSEITLDTKELQEAVWFERKDIPIGDISVSLTSEMIDAFRRGAAD